MSAPTRKAEVAAIAARYPQAFGPPDDTVDARRRLLIPIIARELNQIDGGQWALVNRLDREDDDPRPGRLTADVIAWKPTKEHFDVLTGNGPTWIPYGVITDPDWRLEHEDNWPSWDAVTPPPPTQPPIDADVHAKLDSILAALATIKARQDRPSVLTVEQRP
jgi:hypothetical protein